MSTWRRLLSQVWAALTPRGRQSSAPEDLNAEARGRQALQDRVLRKYIRDRFGSDDSASERIWAAYEDWLLTAEWRIHVVSLDGAHILVPIRLLDALAAEIGKSPLAAATPPWAVDEDVDARARPIRGVQELLRQPDQGIAMLRREHEALRQIVARHGLE